MSGETQKETKVHEPYGMNYRSQRLGVPVWGQWEPGHTVSSALESRVTPESGLWDCISIKGSFAVLSRGDDGSELVAKKIQAENELVSLAPFLVIMIC